MPITVRSSCCIHSWAPPSNPMSRVAKRRCWCGSTSSGPFRWPHTPDHLSVTHEYSEVRYNQFKPPRTFSRLLAIARVLTWPLVWPLASCCKFSDVLFRTVSEALSMIPYFPGVIVRGEFYRFALRQCGENVVVEFGTVFVYRDVSVGSHVLIGRYNTIHHCDFGDYVMTAEGCAFLSGSRH